MDMSDFKRDYAAGVDAKPTDFVPEPEQARFDGIISKDGRVATRNYIHILPSVSCSACICRYIADDFTPDILVDYPNVDGVVGLTQTSGGGCSGYGEGFDVLQRSLAGYATHPNF